MKIIICILLFLLAVPVQGQENAEKWYWGIDESGRLFAYTLSGEVNTLIDTGVSPLQIVRQSDEMAAAVLEIDSQRQFYVLTADTARPVDPGEAVDLDSWRIYYGLNADTVILWNPRPTGISLMRFPMSVINPENGQVIDSGFMTVPPVSNGSSLRYGKVEAENDNITSFQIVEVTADGITPLIEMPDQVIGTRPNENGDYWLTVQRSRTLATFRVLGIEGSDELIDEVDLQEPDSAVRWEIFRNWLIRLPVDCETTCEVMRRPVTGGEEVTYTLEGNDGFFVVLSATPEGDLILQNTETDEALLLTADGSILEVGYFDVMRGLPDHMISPDGRYFLTFNVDKGFQFLWDIAADETLIKENESDFLYLYVVFTDNGILIGEDVRLWTLYRDGEMTRLRDDVQYQDVLADGRVVFSTAPESKLEPGIYVEDLETNTLTLLVPNGRSFTQGW